ncbi:MAG: hypothetical protein BWY15_00143 [Firmicutes bacterium ADurb.Bin193]|nr:MAG: hypothetical protein BWY15_00143 [Firmicutes bacterium ADurb.Bin193]
MSRKVFVSVFANFDTEGRITPLSFKWEDDRIFEIDKITNVCKAASLKAGGAGIRYTCMVCGKQIYLFLEDNKWFVEGK